MQLRWNRFESTLNQTATVAPCYLFYGDEACIQMELRDALIRKLSEAGFDREAVQTVESAHVDWDQFNTPLEAMSLFSSRTLLDIRVTTEKLPADGAKWLATLPERWHEDIAVIISVPKLDKAALSSVWFKALDQAGAMMIATPTLDRAGFKEWIEHRTQSYGLQLDSTAVSALLHGLEGNVFAARQVFERLKLAGYQGRISVEVLDAHMEQAARYEVQQLSEAWLSGQAPRCLDILSTLRGEADALPLLLWQLGEDIHAWWALSQRKTPPMLWGARKIALEQRVQRQRLQPRQFARCIETLVGLDRATKGLQPEAADVWDQLESTVLRWAKSTAR